MDIAKKLNLYNAKTKETKTKEKEEKFKVKDNSNEIDKVVKGKKKLNEFGGYYLIEKRYPLSYSYGGFRLKDLLNINNNVFDLLGKSGCDTKKILFVDTETTGLSSGAGTVAFLVGTGFVKDDKFIIRQYFMRDYDEEAAMLYDINQVFKKTGGVVTYNGKSYDIPLMNTRFTSNRFKSNLKNYSHFDLLHPSRLFWKKVCKNCRLSTIESSILNERRYDDIPGSEIPAEYFKYLDTRNATVMKKVIKHNLLDILSLAALLIKFSIMLNSRSTVNNKNELVALSKIYEKNKEYRAVIKCLERYIKTNPKDVNDKIIKRLSVIYKRTGRHDKAVKLWNYYNQNNLKTKKPVSLNLKVFINIELAKYYEHKQKNYNKALKIVNYIIKYVHTKSFLGEIYLDELEKRRDRLIKKSTNNSKRSKNHEKISEYGQFTRVDTEN